MKKFILNREASRVEHKEVEAESWDAATRLLDKFLSEPIGDDDYIRFNGTIEYAGEVETTA